MEKKKWYEPGFHVCYPHDLQEVRWSRICEIPWYSALVWASITCPEIKLMDNIGELRQTIGAMIAANASIKDIERTFFNGWMNKMLLTVECDDYATALYNHDGKMYVYQGKPREVK